MAQFDESKVINTLHPEKAEIGKEYWYADDITRLKWIVEQDFRDNLGRLEHIYIEDNLFKIESCRYYLLYPYEEPPKKRMTIRQLAEWLAKGHGEFSQDDYYKVYAECVYFKNKENNEVDEHTRIRPWDSEEWIEPTVDIYERDCKGVTK